MISSRFRSSSHRPDTSLASTVVEVIHLSQEFLSPATDVCELLPDFGLFRVCLKRRVGSCLSFSPCWYPWLTKTAISAVVQSPPSENYIQLQWSETLLHLIFIYPPAIETRLLTHLQQKCTYLQWSDTPISFLFSQLGCTPTLTCFQIPSRASDRSTCITVPSQ